MTYSENISGGYLLTNFKKATFGKSYLSHMGKIGLNSMNSALSISALRGLLLRTDLYLKKDLKDELRLK